ncbi:MAG TPA: MinD/ParA family protein, partial [Mycobacterium sp.]|nr:MinD/ParA family protein [Mycobacterium sp.]
MTDRDDALRRELGWTGPEETDYEPPKPKPELSPAPKPPAPSRPPVDFVPPEPPSQADDAATPPAPGPEPGQRAAQPDPPPPPFLDPDRPGGGFRQPPSRYGPPPGLPRDTGPLPAASRPDDGARNQPPGWQPTRTSRPAAQPAPPQPSPAQPPPAPQPLPRPAQRW